VSTPVAKRARKRRDVLRALGLRPIQIWVPDARRPGFAEECHRQSLIVAAADMADRELDTALEASLLDLEADGKV
jgi:hypothetical protein